MPLGALRILNAAFPAQVDGLPAPPAGFVHLLIQYEFTCGTALPTCDAVPQAQLAVELADPNAAPVAESDLSQWTAADAALASGDSARRWAWFLLPASQTPRRLHIVGDRDGDNALDSLATVEIPR
jgi:hypothetical protein